MSHYKNSHYFEMFLLAIVFALSFLSKEYGLLIITFGFIWLLTLVWRTQ